MDVYEVWKRVTEALRADADRGELGPLSRYQAAFPGHEGLVAREHAIVAGRDRGGPPSGLATLEWLPAREREHYTQLGEIARGGMGAILRVRDETLRRELAMKVVLGKGGPGDSSPSGTRGPLARRFLDEAQITAQLDHPGVVPVHELGADEEGRLFFTMKLVKGGRTLADVFRLSREEGSAFNLHRVIQIFLRVLDTLAYAHEKGVIHRDLKPANIMVGDFGEVYVMDWGLAKIVSTDVEEALPSTSSSVREAIGPLTQVGQVLGTPAYMPVEQARNDPLDARADVYAVGAMLYELLTGIHPYGRKEYSTASSEVLLRLLEGPPEPAAKLAPSAAPELVSITEKAMARSRDARYASARELAEDLRNFVEGRVVFAHEAGTWAELRKWTRRNRALAGSVAAAVLLLVAGLVSAIHLGLRAAREREVAREYAYRADIGAAAADLANRDVHAVRLRLQQTPEELRGWEWRHMVSRLDESLLVTEGESMALLPSSRVRMLDREGVVRDHDLVSGTTSVVGKILQRGAHEWITKDGEFVCVMVERPNRRSWHDISFLPVHGGGSVRTALLEIPDDKWDESSRMPRFVYSGTDNRLHVLDVRTGRSWIPPHLQQAGPLDLTGKYSTGRFVLLDRDEGRWSVVYDLDEDVEVFGTARERGAEATCLAVSPDLSLAAIGTNDGGIELRDLARGERTEFEHVRAHRSFVQFVCFHPDGHLLASGGLDRSVALIDAHAGTVLRRYQGHARPLAQGCFTRDGAFLVSRDTSGEIRIWGLSDADPSVLRGHASYVYAIAFSPDGSRLYSGGWDGFRDQGGALRVWDTSTGAQIAALGPVGLCVFSLAVTRDGRRVVTVGGENGDYLGGSLKVWDAETGRLLREHPRRLRTLALHPDGRRAVVAEFVPRGEDRGAIWVLDIETGDLVARLVERPADWAALSVDAAWSRDGRLLATPGAAAKSVLLFDADSYRRLREIPLPDGELTSLAFAPDSSQLLTTATDDSWRLWDVASGAQLAARSGAGSEILAGAFTPDGTRILTAGRDQNLRVWDVGAFEQIARLTGHTDYVKALAVSPDGETVASASGDGTVRLWQTRTAAEIHIARIQRAALLADLTPRVRALFQELGDPERVVERLRVLYRDSAREVALQIALQEAAARVDGAAPRAPDGSR